MVATSLAALAAGAAPAQAAGPGGGDVDDIDRSIVWVLVEFTGTVDLTLADGTPLGPYAATAGVSCTGWFASDVGHVVTAGHCLEDGDPVGQAMIDNLLEAEGIDPADPLLQGAQWSYQVDETLAHVGQPSGIDGGPLSGQRPMLAQHVGSQDLLDGDNALLKIANMEDTPALPVADGKPEVGQEVISIGFASSVSSVTDEVRQPPSHKRGTVSSLQSTKRGVPHTEIDAAISFGMSGGPTIGEDGAVIGTNSFGVAGESQPFNFVTDTETMRTFLESNGVELAADAGPLDPAQQPVPASDPGPEPSGLVSLRTPLIAGVSVAIAGLLGVLGTMGFLGMQKRRHSAPSVQQ